MCCECVCGHSSKCHCLKVSVRPDISSLNHIFCIVSFLHRSGTALIKECFHSNPYICSSVICVTVF